MREKLETRSLAELKEMAKKCGSERDQRPS